MGWSLVVASWWEGLTRVVGFWLKDGRVLGRGFVGWVLWLDVVVVRFRAVFVVGSFFLVLFVVVVSSFGDVEFRNFHDVGMIGDRLGIC